MLNNIQTNSYIDTNSFFHKLHPFVKIISILLILFLSIYCNSITSHFLIIIVIFTCLAISKISFSYYFKAIKQLKYFLLTLFIFNLFFIDINSNIVNILRLVELILYSKMMLYTTKVSAMNKGITMLCYPLKLFKINPEFISMSITLTIRFIPIVLDEMNQFIKSLKTRGIYFTKNIKQNIIIIKKIIVPIFTHSIERADRIASMMELKGFSFNKKRSSYFNYSITLRDIIFIIILILISIFLIRGEMI